MPHNEGDAAKEKREQSEENGESLERLPANDSTAAGLLDDDWETQPTEDIFFRSGRSSAGGHLFRRTADGLDPGFHLAGFLVAPRRVILERPQHHLIESHVQLHF